jgi:hypothetical protein
MRVLFPSCSWQLLRASALAVLATTLIPASSHAAISTFGSPLSVPATLNTAENLNYKGTDTAVPPTAENPSGNVHTYHYGADAAQWNVVLASGTPAAPTAGQAVKVALEGCAVPSADGTPPLTQIHFQSLSPLPGGGAKVNLSSGAYDIPVCGVGGTSGSTVTTYEPINLCVSQGDYVAFNDEGGFVEHSYQSGVPYKVLGAVPGSSFDSFIRGGGTNNGDSFPSSDTSTMDGFANNPNEELMLQATLGTGPDATPACGGTKGVPVPISASVPLRVSRQTDGVNRHRIVSIAVYCRISPECKGVATLTLGKGHYGSKEFALPPNKTSHLPIRISAALLKLIRKHHGVSTTFTATTNGKTVTQTVGIKIL